MDNKKKIMALVLATSAGTGAVLIQDGNVAHADDLHKSMLSEKMSNTGEVINISSCLRVRAKSNTSSEIIGYLYNGNKVNIKGKEGSFYKIDYEGKAGFVHEDYVKLGSNNSNNTNSSGKGKVVNISSSLRMRSGAGTNHSTIGYLYEGNTFDILGKSGDWYKIKANGKTGYVYGEYVEVIGSGHNNNNSNNTNNNNTNVNNKMGQVKNVSSSLRVRSGAGTNHSVVGYLSNGDKFKILEKSGSWYKINGNGTIGYVHSDYVAIVGESSNNNNSNSSNNNHETSEKSIGKVINISSNLRIRNAPSTNSSVVGYLLNGQTFNITGKSGSFYKINHNGTTGYVHQDYVQIVGSGNSSNNGNSNSGSESAVNQYGKLVNVSTSLRLRKEPNTSSSVIGYLVPGEVFKIESKHGDWYKVNSNGKTGYASADYIRIVDKNSETSTSATTENLINILKAQIGSPYMWGGKGEFITTDSIRMFKNTFPNEAAQGKYDIPSKYINSGYRAFDCSGLFYWGFKQIGINIGGSTYSQINNGREVSVNDARPGDLLFYGNLQHVGMYLGDGKWIEAPKSHDYVKIANVPWSRIGRVRRIIN